jgi:hypothetical protein
VESRGKVETRFSEDTVFAVAKDQISCDLQGEAVVLNFQDGTYYGLNQVGASIWNLVQSPCTVRDIREKILDEFEVDRSQCEADLQAFLQELFSRKLVVIENQDA